jgi:hypothetical protein
MSVETFDKLLRFEIDRDENYISVTCEREEDGNLFEDYMTFHADDVIEMSFSPRDHEHKQDYITTIQFSRIGNDCTFETTKANVLKIEEALFKNKSPKFLLLPESELVKENSNALKESVKEKSIVKDDDILTPKEIEALWSSPCFNMPSRANDELQLQEEQIISDTYLLSQALPQTTDVREAYTRIKNCLKQGNVIKARWLYTHLPQFKDDKVHQIIDAELRKDSNDNPCLYFYVGDTNWFYGNDCCVYTYDKDDKIPYLIYKPKHLVLKEIQIQNNQGGCERDNKTGENDCLSITMPIYLPCVKPSENESTSSKVEKSLRLDRTSEMTSDIYEAAERINRHIKEKSNIVKAYWFDNVRTIPCSVTLTEAEIRVNSDRKKHFWGKDAEGNNYYLDDVYVYYTNKNEAPDYENAHYALYLGKTKRAEVD